MWRQPRPRWSKAESRFAWRTRISFVCQLACKHNYIGYKSCGDNHYRDGTKRNRGSHGAHSRYMLRIDCWEVEKDLKTTPGSQCALNALAIDNPLEYARLYLDGMMQVWVDAEDSLES